MPSGPVNHIKTGTVFHGRYRVGHCLGAGAMGSVYEVFDETTRSRRALKVMQSDIVRDPAHRARFAVEAQITGEIESDHIVRVLDAGIDIESGMPFLTMELLRGESLRATLQRQTRLPPLDVARYLYQIALALAKTHGAGIIHRDLKPDNLFLTHRDDGSPCIKILDFGIARVVAHNQQGAATRAGTPLYVAPEQILGKGRLGPSADIYALAHIAYELLVGEPYWFEEQWSIEGPLQFYRRVVNGPIEAPCARAMRRANFNLPRGFDGWFFRAAAKRPEDRFASAIEAASALGSVLGERMPSFVALTVPAVPLMVDEAMLREISAEESIATGTIPMDSLPDFTRGVQPDTNFDAAATIPLPKAPRPVFYPTRRTKQLAALVLAIAPILAVTFWKLFLSASDEPPAATMATEPTKLSDRSLGGQHEDQVDSKVLPAPSATSIFRPMASASARISNVPLSKPKPIKPASQPVAKPLSDDGPD